MPFDDGEHDRRPPPAFISADYDDFKPETFRAFVVTIGDAATRFEGHPYVAYRRACDFAYSQADRVFDLSSVDDLTADLAKA